jgi:DnaK suppressor protein
MDKTLKKNLLKMREELLKGIDQSIKNGSSLDREVGDFYDAADIEKNSQMMHKLGEREQVKLKAIDLALMKIDDGDYGECEECGETINKKRLKILPFARYCVRCQSELEQKCRQQTGESLEDKLLYKEISLNDIETAE